MAYPVNPLFLTCAQGGIEVKKAVSQRIRPSPILRVEARTDDPSIHKRQPLPNYLETIQEGEKTYIKFKNTKPSKD